MRTMMQAESAECGLACLAMISSYHGFAIDVATLRRRGAPSTRGASLRTLMSAARDLHLAPRALRVEPGELEHVALPCVLHWDLNHFVVLHRVHRGRFEIHDPGRGRRDLDATQLSRHFTGVALELQPTPRFARGDVREELPLRRMVGRVPAFGRDLASLLGVGLALQALAIAPPIFLRWAIDHALPRADVRGLALVAAGASGLIVLQAMLSAMRGRIAVALSARLNLRWLNDAFDHLLRLPLSYFESRHAVDIASRFDGIGIIQQALGVEFVEAVLDGLLAIAGFALMLFSSPALCLVSVVTVLAYAALRSLFHRRLRSLGAEHLGLSTRQHAHFIETTRAALTIRLFGREAERQAVWANLLVDEINAKTRMGRIVAWQQSANVMLLGAERVVAIAWGAWLVLQGTFTVGMLMAFLGYKEIFLQRAVILVDKTFEARLLKVHVDRLADILLHAPEKRVAPACPDAPATSPEIEFRAVSFRFSADSPLVLDGLSLRIPPGQNVAITGPSGCGKTTLLKLMLGILEPTGGQVLVDGQPLRDFGLDRLRAVTGAVMQSDTLLTGSLVDNISFFDAEPDLRRVTQAARDAAIHDDIEAMPMRFETRVGEGGTALSGGQAQRVLLARALYRRPLILVLDEATSSLDAANERGVNASIAAQAMSRIVVAHREETIRSAERVVHLSKGRVV